jgi:tetratricopeptide (TPR) repeat protein
MLKGRKATGRAASRHKSETPSLPEDFLSVEKPASSLIIILVVLALVILNLIIYAPSLQYGFLHFDDSKYVSENVAVSRGVHWNSVLWAFNIGYSANWHPLTWLSHMLDVQLFGMMAPGHHLTNVLLHIANSLLLFWLLYRTTCAWRRSAVVALLFAVHPLHVESVVWIAERKDVLSTLLWMLTFHAYVSYTRRPTLPGRLAILAAFALGLMAKPMLITLPFMLLLFDVWPLGRLNVSAGQWRPLMKLFVEKIPLFALSAISGIITVVAQFRGGAIQNLDMLPFSQRVANALASYLLYIAQMLWPRSLIAHYSYERIALWLAGIGLLILLLISALSLKVARRYPFILVGWMWYLCTLLPVIGLIQVGTQSRADRYTYVPFIGLFIIAAWGMPKLFTAGRYGNIGFGIATGILICTSTVLARNQVLYWENDLTLWGHAVQLAPRNYFARTNLGVALLSAGELDAALDQFGEALRIEPYAAETHNGLGIALFRKGLWKEAAFHYAEAIRLSPRFAEAHSNMGMLLGTLGKDEEAIAEFQTALRIDPQIPDIYYNLGFSLARLGKMDEAIAKYEEALRIKPANADAHAELGNAYFLKGELGSAMRQYRQALEINPELESAHNNLGLALMNEKRFMEAIFQFREALRINPNNVEERKNLEAALEGQ